MKIIRGISKIRQRLKHPVVTIGMFDGVHLAHQEIIKQVVRQAKLIKGKSCILTFILHPLKMHRRRVPAPMITTLEQRLDLIRRLNADTCILLDFNKRFSQLSAQDFVKDILVNLIGASQIIVGQGFRFGRNKSGPFLTLKKLAWQYGLSARKIKAVKLGGRMVSSSRIRSLIQAGEVAEANRFLGRAFSIGGKVARGSARGRILGYPTANIDSVNQLVPACGVYAVLVKLDGEILPGILNIGFRPTFKSEQEPLKTIEAHIFNFSSRIYGRRLEIFFIQRIRSEQKFSSQDKLLEQIKQDGLRAQTILRSRKSPAQ